VAQQLSAVGWLSRFFKFSRHVQELIRGVQKHRLLAAVSRKLSQPKRVVRIESEVFRGGWGLVDHYVFNESATGPGP
jgi:hypothetical protein